MKHEIKLSIMMAIAGIAMFSCGKDKPTEKPKPQEKTLVSIAITTQPTKTTYTVGNTFDPAGMVVTATYSDNSTAPVTVTAAMLAYDFGAAGSKTVTITYEGKTATVTCTVNAASVSEKETILEELNKNDDLSEFVAALEQLDLAGINAEELTVFALKNSGMGKSSIKAAGDDEFDIMRHVVSGKYPKSSLTDGQQLTALDGTTLTIIIMGGRIYVNGVELGAEITTGGSVVYIVEQTLPATSNTAQYSITTHECNASWTPENNTSYLTASDATVSLRDSLGRALGPYTTGTDGKVTMTLVKGRYTYKVTKGNASNISKDGFLIAGIFTSQQEIDNYPRQSSAVLGGLKFADLNYDGIINNDDKPSEGFIRLLPTQDTYIAAADFEPSYKPQPPVDVNELIAQLQADFTSFTQRSYFVDAHITKDMEATNVISQPLWNFSFAANNSDITSLWNFGYSIVSIADQLAESNASAEQKNDVAIMRLYTLSVLCSYFGGLPLDTDSPRMSAQETAQYLVANSDALIGNSSEPQKAKVLMLKARVLLNQPQPDYMGALNALKTIEYMGRYQLPPGGSFLPWGYNWTTSTTCESIWEGIPVGSIKKQTDQIYAYPMRFTETVLMQLECFISLQQMMDANENNNKLRYLWGFEPENFNDWNSLRDNCEYFWGGTQNSNGGFMFREGLRYAFLKRNGILNRELPNVKELLPIPESAFNQNPYLTQNPGW